MSFEPSSPIMYSITPCDVMYCEMQSFIMDMGALYGAFAQCVDTGTKEAVESADNIMYCLDTCDRCVGS